MYLKIREDLHTIPIEMNIESTSIAQEEPVFFDTTDQHERTEKELWKHEKKPQNAILIDPPVITVPQCRVITQKTYTKTQQS